MSQILAQNVDDALLLLAYHQFLNAHLAILGLSEVHEIVRAVFVALDADVEIVSQIVSGCLFKHNYIRVEAVHSRRSVVSANIRRLVVFPG